MDIPPYLLLPYFQVTQGFVTLSSGSGQIVQADPSRIYLAIMLPLNSTGQVKPDGFPAGHLGFNINSTYGYIEFKFSEHPGLVGLGWSAAISAPGDVTFISIAYKPEG